MGNLLAGDFIKKVTNTAPLVAYTQLLMFINEMYFDAMSKVKPHPQLAPVLSDLARDLGADTREILMAYEEDNKNGNLERFKAIKICASFAFDGEGMTDVQSVVFKILGAAQ